MKGLKRGIFLLVASCGLLAAVFGWQRPVQVVSGAAESLPIRLGYSTFDPLIDGEPTVPPTLRANSATPYALLQFSGPIRPEWGEALRAAGVVFYAYLPEYTYLVRLPAGDRTAIVNYPAVRWVGPFHPAYKISPYAVGGRILLDLFPDADVAGVAAAARMVGATVVELYQGERARLVVVEAPAGLIPALAALEGVAWVQTVRPMAELNDDARWVTQGFLPYVHPLYERGLTGLGQVGGIADSGLSVYDFPGGLIPTVPSCFFLDDGNNGAGGVALPPSATHRKVIGYTIPTGAIADMEDGSGHGSHVVGSFTGDRPPWHTLTAADGQAYEARVLFQDIGLGTPAGVINPPTDLHVLFDEAYDPNNDNIYQPLVEPRTHSNSWGSTEPTYRPESVATDDFAWTHPDFLILFAAGNQGPTASSLGYPANAKNDVTVGATENGLADPNSMGYFSSHGPGPTGRLEPVVSAPGDRVISALANNPCATAERTGSSMAAPTTHGIAVLMRQYLANGYYPGGQANPADSHHPSAALLKALLMNSGRPLDGNHSDNLLGGSWPSNGQGWGRVTADDALYFQGDHRALWLRDEYNLSGTAGLTTTDATRTYTLTVGDGRPLVNEPLEVTLVWTDYPGLPLVGSLVNNLDLTVTDPAGVAHLGNDADTNNFQGVPDLPPVTSLLRDSINPWEVVYLANPISGTYTVTVNLANMPSALLGGRRQGFALVVTGDLISRQGRAELEYPFYDPQPAEVASLRVTDLDLNANPLAIEQMTVLITSTTQPAGVAVTLTEVSPNSAIFGGQVTLTKNAPAVGQLQVAAGGTVRLTYQDADNGRSLLSNHLNLTSHQELSSSEGTKFLSAAVAYDTAKMAARPINFSNPPELSDPGGVDSDGNYMLNWSAPGAGGAGLRGYVIQETVVFSRPLFDNAEGTVTTNWTTGQTNWRKDSQAFHSPANSYWSGAGSDPLFPFGIDSSLTLNHDVTIPITATSGRLTFYSRYYNDSTDYGFVELSTNGGGSWSPVLVQYADPLSGTLGTEMRHWQVDLTSYIGTPLRVRFRFNNGLATVSPSPGWWVDDITISGGAWQTIATVGPNTTSYNVTGRGDGHYYYRVQPIYADGSAAAQSDVEDMMVSGPTVIGLREVTADQTLNQWWIVVGFIGLAGLMLLVHAQRPTRKG